MLIHLAYAPHCALQKVEVNFEIADACGHKLYTQGSVVLVDSTPPTMMHTSLTPVMDASSKACAEMPQMQSFAEQVCATSKVNGKCTRQSNFPNAAEVCAAEGARLCTRNEVRFARNTGCGLDFKHIWTSSRYVSRIFLDLL